MTVTLYRALVGRLAVITISALLLGGIAVEAALSRPPQTGRRVGTTSCFDPAAPERGWISCAGEVPL